MDESRFFELIQSARPGADPKDPSADPEALAELLEELDDEQVAGFALEYERQLIRLNRWAIWGAGYVADGGMGDDGFHYFRSWIVGKGVDAVQQALGDPDGLVDFMADDDELDNELLECVAMEILEDRGIQDDPTDELDDSADGDPEGEPFDEDDVDGDFPRIAAWADGQD